LHEPRFNHLPRTPTCDRWTHDDSIYRASIGSCGKNLQKHYDALKNKKCRKDYVRVTTFSSYKKVLK